MMKSLILTVVISLSSAGSLEASQDVRFFLPDREGGYLGLRLRDLSRDEAAALGAGQVSGVFVEAVAAGSPAERAGLQRGDIITRYAGYALLGVRQFQRLVGETPPERQIELQVFRGGQPLQLQVEVEGRRQPWAAVPGMRVPLPEVPEVQIRPSDPMRRFFFFSDRPRLGISGGDLTGQMAEFMGMPGRSGVLVLEVMEDSPAERAGLKAGDVITAVDGRTVVSLQELSRLLVGEQHELELVRERQTLAVTVILAGSGVGTEAVRI